MSLPNPVAGSGTRLAVIGDPIAHSLSPLMQQAALDRAGVPWTYETIRVSGPELPSVVDDLRAGRLAGINVTIPHKRAILPFLDTLTPTAARTGAVNTVCRDGPRLVGHNTDVAGFTSALTAMEPNPSGPAILFGTGGAASAVLSALTDMGMAVSIVSRERERAEAFGREFGAGAFTYADRALSGVIAEAGLLVNATPMGMGHLRHASPLSYDVRLKHGAVAIDLVYGQSTPFIKQTRERGCRVQNGIEMLVRQGALAFALWTGIEPDLDVMRDACIRALAARSNESAGLDGTPTARVMERQCY